MISGKFVKLRGGVFLGLFALCALAVAPASSSAALDGPGWQLWATADPSNFVHGVDAVQEVIPQAPSFVLGFEGQETTPISSSANAPEVEEALESLSTVGTGNVSVSTQAGDYRVSFTGALGGSHIAALTASGATISSVTRGLASGTIRVAVLNVGAAASEEGQPITITDTLPPGVTARQAGALVGDSGARSEYPLAPEFIPNQWDCTGNGPGPSGGVGGATVVTCTNDPVGLPQIAGGGGPPATYLAVTVQATGEASGLTNHVSISGGGALGASATANPVTIGSQNLTSGLVSGDSWFSNADGTTDTQAGSHPYAASFAFTPAIAVNARKEVFRPGDENESSPGLEVRDLETRIPPGLVGDLSRMPQCPLSDLLREKCDPNSIVGSVRIETLIISLGHPVFNMVPAPGAAAQVGFNFNGVWVPIRFGVRTGDDYSVVARLQSPSKEILQTILTLWGVPQTKSHEIWHSNGDRQCSEAELEQPEEYHGELNYCARAWYQGAHEEAFLTMPTSCEGPQPFSFDELDAWQDPEFSSQTGGLIHDAEGNPVGFTGCNRLPFEPTISSKPTTDVADSPSGLDFNLHFPQTGLEDPAAEVSEADLKRAVVVLPKGVAVNPSSANGLGACSEPQIGYLGKEAGLNTDRYTPAPPECPDASKIGTVEVDTPLLRDRNEAGEATDEHPLLGDVYVAKPVENPFGSLLAIYITVDDPSTGIVVKLAGEVHANSQTGQLTATVENPQVPFEDVHLEFFKGAGATLRTPQLCGRYQTTTDMTPWSAPEGADAFPTDSFEVTQSPGGGACPHTESQLPDAPSFEAGTLAPKAAVYSPFILHLARADGSQEIKGIDTTLPEGLIGKLAGVSECSDAQIAQAVARDGIGQGRLEQQSPSCPLSSEVGTVSVGAGAGPAPYYVSGHAYLAGPYKGAPLSLEIVTPAVAGPFDLGAVAIRTALYVDPESTQIHAVSDEIPHILQGIPLDVRSINLSMDRPSFTLNPTSCAKKAVLANATSILGQIAPLSVPFQVGGCNALGFKPSLKLSLKGSTKRSGVPALKAVLTYPKGSYANISSLSTVLPKSEYIDNAHIGNVCTRPQFAAEACPARSILGHAVAYSPLLEKPLEGTVYFRANGGERELPDIVVSLRGQIDVNLVGFVDAVKKNKNSEVSRIRTRFQNVPDAPVSKFVLQLAGANHGLLENSANLCEVNNIAQVKMVAQNGKIYDTEPVIANDCGKKTNGAKKGSGKHHKAGRRQADRAQLSRLLGGW